MRFTEDELTNIDNIKWMKGSYVDFLRLWQPRYEDFEITTDSDCGLSIETFGTWLNTSMYEIPTLAIVNEVYFRMAYNYEELLNGFKKRLDVPTNLDGLCNVSFKCENFSTANSCASAESLLLRPNSENVPAYQ